MTLFNRLAIFIAAMCVLPLNAQEDYFFPASTKIADLPGDHFLTYAIRNNKVYFEERDVTGAALWSDSLNNDGALQTVQQFVIQRFGETGNYRLFLQGAYTADSMLVRHATLSIATHAYGVSRIDTMRSKSYFSVCSPSDTTVYLFTNDYDYFDDYKHDVFSIHTDGSVTQIAAMENLHTTPVNSFGYRFVPRQGGIYELYTNYSDQYARQYDLQMQPVTAVDSTTFIHDDWNFSEPLHLQLQGADSLLVCFYLYEFSGSNQAWGMAWLTSGLDELLKVENIFGSATDPSYTMNYGDVAMPDNYIYLLTYKYDDGMPVPARHMFVYDNALQPVCDYPTAAVDDDKLTVLNGNAFIIHDGNDGVNLFRVDGCGIAAMDQSVAGSFKLFPNPANDVVTLRTTENVAGKTLRIFTVSGQEAMHVVLSDAFENTIDHGLEPGVYFIRTNESGVTQQLIVR